MRAATAVVALLAAAGLAAADEPAARTKIPGVGSASRAYRDVRGECAHGGKTPRTDQILADYGARWWSASERGARLVRGWDQLTDAQRAAFSAELTRRVLAPSRRELVVALCNPRDRYLSESQTEAGTTHYSKVWLSHLVAEDELQVGIVFRDAGTHWSFERFEVPSSDYPGIDDDPISAATRAALTGDYAHALIALAQPGIGP